MLSNSEIKHIKSLQLKKYRTKLQQFVIEGSKNVLEILQSDYTVIQIFALSSWIEDHQDSLDAHINKVNHISEKELNRISTQKTPSGTIALISIPEVKEDKSTIQNSLSLVLDNIQDPGNLGSIVRTADWFGIPYIFCSPDTVDLYNPKTVNATMGSITRVKVIYTDILSLLDHYQQLTSFATTLDGNDIFESRLKSNGFIVLGNESKGISENVLKKVNQKVKIPSYSSKADSLNVAIATGIICAAFKSKKV